MPQDNRKDISDKMLEFMMVSLISHKVNILIVGAGRAGLIKAKAFLNNGCRVFVLSKEFSPEFFQVENDDRLILIKDEYKKEIILDKHIVAIATDDYELNEKVKADCESLCKIYLNCRDFREGMLTIPTQRKTENLHFALHTRKGSPKTSVFLAEKMKCKMEEYEAFVLFASSLRQKLKGREHFEEIMNFVNTDFFYQAYKKGNGIILLKMYYGGGEFEF
ncbi:siroheme synthase [Oxobacter pfennigii]|uniref:precorrin-2 dehydrogenase n=1 Tax=Oxobacter pfennigii TaxID=36849 RepID=A0A0P8W4V7_9CLOT|nr:NAD(P)-dependent oxidoreductase [Oxobacter pfennigii]KPU43613.1 siroheme synthase [Oxobacter pfennigii]